MDSKVEENYKRLREELNERLNNDKRLTAILDKIAKGTATFKDSARYSQIVADHMGDVISKNIGKITVPLGKEAVCKKLLKENIERVDTMFGEVQVSVDEKMGIHLNPVKPPYPTERVNAIAHSLEDPNADDEKVARRGKSSGNVVAARHDENVKANAAWREKAGFDCYLVRDAGGGCCPWCAALAGRYKYADAPDDVFRRHDNCTCILTYICGKQRQDAWSKESNWSKEQSQEYMRQHDSALAAKREELRAKGVDVKNMKLNKEEIEAIKARIDAAEAAKPTVNTPEQAKELEKQILEKNPVTKFTPEQAKAIDEQSKATVNTPEQAKELEDKLLGNVNNKSVDNPEKSAIMELKEVRDLTISAIESPIEQQHTGKGNPNAILTFDVELTNRQKDLLEMLPEFDSQVVIPRDSVNMADLSALTAKTGHEFAMFTKGGERLIVRGNEVKVNINLDDAKRLSSQGYRWSGHTHPGIDFLCMQPSDGDYSVLDCFKQENSVIYNSKGDFRTFEKRGE